MKLKKKVLCLFLLTVATQIIFGIFINSVVVKNTVMKNTLTYTRCIVVNIQQRISKQFQEIRDISQSIIYNEEIYNILCENNPHEMYLENYECQKQVNGILKNLVFRRMQFRVLRFTTTTVILISGMQTTTFQKRKTYHWIS